MYNIFFFSRVHNLYIHGLVNRCETDKHANFKKFRLFIYIFVLGMGSFNKRKPKIRKNKVLLNINIPDNQNSFFLLLRPSKEFVFRPSKEYEKYFSSELQRVPNII